MYDEYIKNIGGSIKKLLIANRGEAAMRAIRTCKSLKIESAVIYFGDDASSDWVAAADYAFALKQTNGSANMPYMDIRQIVHIASKNNCQAIWPGWGFLSENASFAMETKTAGLIWVGPSKESMKLLSSKSDSSKLARECGFDIIPELNISEDEKHYADVDLEFPLLIKPSLGGGGKGQRIVYSRDDFIESVNGVSKYAKSSYGCGDVVVQKYLYPSKHIEIQLICDELGNVVLLGTRNCSIQRMNQKIIEESPSGIDESIMIKASEAAKELFKRAKYVSAGTVETLFANNKLYFLEVNTRLQVEHTVTEESIKIFRNNGSKSENLDLIAEMLNVASGKPLTFREDEISSCGHAIEARIYAENPDDNFAPTPGRIYFVRFPNNNGIRVDTAVVGPEVSVSRHFDPMLAKIIAFDSDRRKAIVKLADALSKTVILGIKTNVAFLRRITATSDFTDYSYDTDFVKKHKGDLNTPHGNNAALAWAIAAITSHIKEFDDACSFIEDTSIVSLESALALLPDGRTSYKVIVADEVFLCDICQWSSNRFEISNGDDSILLDVNRISPHVYTVRDMEGHSYEAFLYKTKKENQIVLNGEYYYADVEKREIQYARKDHHASPYSGKIRKICVSEGDSVKKGDELYILEAMKMESRICSIGSGKVKGIILKDGDAVETGESVLEMDLDDSDKAEDKPMMALPIPHLSLTSESLDDGAYVSDIPELYFKGYDLGYDMAMAALEDILYSNPKQASSILSRLCDHLVAAYVLRNETLSNAILNMAKGRIMALNDMPNDDMAHILQLFGVNNLRNVTALRMAIPRILRWMKNTDLKHYTFAADFIERCITNKAMRNVLIENLIKLIKCGAYDNEGSIKNRLLISLRKLSPPEYYKIIKPPVALDYLDDYERYRANPIYNLSDDEILKMRADANGENCDTSSKCEYDSLGTDLSVHFQKWFEGFSARQLNISAKAKNLGVRLFELVMMKDKGEDRRLLSVALVGDASDGESFFKIECSAIEAYRCISQYEVLGTRHSFNHVFIVLPQKFVLPWSPSNDSQESISPFKINKISSRIAGFAKNIHVTATEVILNLKTANSTEKSLLEIRHVDPIGIMNRPPYPLADRIPEFIKGEKERLDEKQHRLGKLINEDRAHILFDGGKYKELFFPNVDDVDIRPVGLRVFKGNIDGIESMAYAGDFRIKGGALGEREGKKLASAVILAYVSKVPLVGIHDGAGADIRGSVASLGWAGAYFGAIANTGGFSDEGRFWRWFNGHHERKYFERVLYHFGFKPNSLGIWEREGDKNKSGKFTHIHLNLGATVGMLVYGASISSMSVMVDKPQAYRVLTGSAAVRRVTGERTSNYELGGANVHALYSGDIDLKFKNEEDVLGFARRFISFLKFQHKSAMPKKRIGADVKRIDRENIPSLMDAGSFIETRSEFKGTSALVTGFGRIYSTNIALAANLSDYGMRNRNTLKKLYSIYAASQEFGLPLILVSCGKWYGMPEGVPADVIYEKAEADDLLYSLSVPRITLSIGPNSLDDDIHRIADICCYVDDGTESEYDINRANILAHLRYSSVTDCLYDISRFVANIRGNGYHTVSHGSDGFKIPIPLSNYAQAYDMRAVITGLMDADSFVELYGNDSQPLIVGIASMEGLSVGVIADDPQIGGGAQTAQSLSKFTRFNRLCNRFQIPIIELNDSPAFQPGSRQERMGIQGEGGKSLREECISNLPRLAVTLRQNYGGRYIHANLKTLGPIREGIICKDAKIGVMGADGAIEILNGRQLASLPKADREAERAKLLAEYEKKSLNPITAVKLGYAKEVVEMDDLQNKMKSWLKDAHLKIQLKQLDTWNT